MDERQEDETVADELDKEFHFLIRTKVVTKGLVLVADFMAKLDSSKVFSHAFLVWKWRAPKL